jgi:uncharacterized Ntn-hydrolase superfamily protein
MLQALEAAERAGGDIRGRQSASILVVRAQPSGKPWNDRIIDLRVEDSPQPLEELRRLVRLRRAYTIEDQGDAFIAEGKTAEALDAYTRAARLAPEVTELQFWAAVSMYGAGRKEEALRTFRDVFTREPVWADLVPRLARVGLFPDSSAAIEEVRRQRPAGKERR